MGIAFQKWHGLGNDFVIMTTDPGREAAIRICDRHRGIGADGVLIVTELESSAPTMVVRNADGSRPEMCGNGIRCVVAYIAEAAGAEQGSMTLTTDTGLRSCDFLRNGNAYDVEVDMGVASVGVPQTHEALGRTLIFHAIDMGNPHLVTFDVIADDAFDDLAIAVQARQPAGANIEMVADEDNRLVCDVYERGVGRTEACGTGACAVAVAACEHGIRSVAEPIEVLLPGGALTISVTPELAVRMRGPAQQVFSGEW